MSKLAQITSRELIQKLKGMGFIEDHTTGSHIVFYHSETNRRVVVPYHNKDIKKGTLSAILREAGITRKEFLAH